MTQINFSQLQKILNQQLNGFWLKPNNQLVKIFDGGTYLCYSVSEMTKVLSTIKPPSPFIQEVFDCEDFAFFYKSQLSLQHASLGASFPLIAGMGSGMFGQVNEKHMINWFVDDTLRFLWIESQNKSIQPIDYCHPQTLELLIS